MDALVHGVIGTATGPYDTMVTVSSNFRTDAASWEHISTDVGGPSTAGGSQTTNNPAEATVTAATGGNGSGTIVATFKSNNSSDQTILGLGLVKTTTATAPSSTGTGVADSDLFAAQNVNITLSQNDTLEITWTVAATGTTFGS